MQAVLDLEISWEDYEQHLLHHNAQSTSFPQQQPFPHQQRGGGGVAFVSADIAAAIIFLLQVFAFAHSLWDRLTTRIGFDTTEMENVFLKGCVTYQSLVLGLFLRGSVIRTRVRFREFINLYNRIKASDGLCQGAIGGLAEVPEPIHCGGIGQLMASQLEGRDPPAVCP
jgi:hypothetical protein